MKESIIAGVVGLIIGMIAMYLVYYTSSIEFTTFKEALIAVAIASFFASFFACYFCRKWEILIFIIFNYKLI